RRCSPPRAGVRATLPRPSRPWRSRPRATERVEERHDDLVERAGLEARRALVVGLRRLPGRARGSALAPTTEEDEPVTLPGPDEPVSFDANVKPLFRERDRQAMRFAFDLWAYDDVSQHADAILDQVRAGTMPCDGAWPAERVAVLERWVASGK